MKATHKLDHFTKAPSEQCDILQHARPRSCFSVWTTVGETKRKRHFSPSLFFIHSSNGLCLVVDPKHNNRLTLSSLKHGQLCFQHWTRSHKQNNGYTILEHRKESLNNEHCLWVNMVWCAAKGDKICEGLSWHVEAGSGQATLDTVTGAEEEGSLAILIVKKKWLYSKFPDCTLEARERWDSFAFGKIHRRGCTVQLMVERVRREGILLCLILSPQEWYVQEKWA